jgi:hypothetical protein
MNSFSENVAVNAELVAEGIAYIERVDCPNCFGSGFDLDLFSDAIVCPLCEGSCRVVADDLPLEWQDVVSALRESQAEAHRAQMRRGGATAYG